MNKYNCIESIFGLQLAREFLETPEHSGFTLINDSRENAENNIICDKYYIIHMTELDTYLICTCHNKGFCRADMKVFGKIANDVIDVISSTFYIGYDFSSHRDGIEFIQWEQYDPCDIYIYDK